MIAILATMTMLCPASADTAPPGGLTAFVSIAGLSQGDVGPVHVGLVSDGGGQSTRLDALLTSETSPIADSAGIVCAMAVTAGAVVAPNTATGLASSQTLAGASAAHGVGVATLDADLSLLLPVLAKQGNYRGTLTITAI